MIIKEPSQRQLKVGQEIKKIVANLTERGVIVALRNVDALITITEVRVSPDLKYCTVFFITSKDDINKEVLGLLQSTKGVFRKEIATKTSLRYVPEIIFKIDESFEAVDRIEKLLHDDKVQQDLKNK